MKAKVVAQLLADLCVTKSHSRPNVSDDNPYSESQFKTLKYRPDFPDRFGSQLEARSFCAAFFHWYNTEHRHSGIGLLTPEDMHYGRAGAIVEARATVLTTVYKLHPERFVRGLPKPPVVPSAAWINQPKDLTDAGWPPQPKAEGKPSPKMAAPPEVHQTNTTVQRPAFDSREVLLQ